MNLFTARRWVDLPLRGKALVAISLPLVVLLSSLVLIYIAERQTARAEEDVRRVLLVQGDIQAVHPLLAEAAASVRGYLLTRRQDFLPGYQQAKPQIKVVIFTMDDSPDHLEAAIGAGAVGYLLKDASRDEVINALQRVGQGEEALNSAVSARLLRRMAERNSSGTPQAQALTPRERQVLGLVAGGFSNREIGEKLGITTGTAKAHVERVIGKLGAADRTQAAVRGIALGLVAQPGGQWP